MRIFGLSITRAAPPAPLPAPRWGGVGSGRGWQSLIVREPYSGAWQRNDELRLDSVLAYPAVFACQSLIASDISKLGLRLVRRDSDGIWNEVSNPAYSPVLRRPNHFQNRIQFIESWITSKYEFGNAYLLKQRDGRGVVVALYVLDPCRVTPLVARSGDVYYELRRDDLAGLEGEDAVTVPAREIIHDRFNCFFHPLVGLSPIFANGLAAMGGLAIEKSSADFFANGSTVPGMLTAPGSISDETAARLKSHWEENYGGSNAGKIAVLGDGLKFEAMAVKAVDAQLIEQLKWSAETVCSTYHVPPYKIGIGSMPTYNNIQALNTEYYSQCLQVQIEQMELCLDEGLGLTDDLGVEFDIDNLLRMDSQTLITAIKDGTGAGVMKPNEGRKKLNLGPVEGGDTPYLQVQNYSLAALARRDNGDDAFAPPSPPPAPPTTDDESPESPEERAALVAIVRDFIEVLRPEAVWERMGQETQPLQRRLEALEEREAAPTVSGALIDQSGVLNVTLSDGTVRPLGKVVGEPGPQGPPGVDGIPFDEFAVTLGEDDRTLSIAASTAEKEVRWDIPLPHPVDRGVWAEGKSYQRGDAVSWGGSLFIAQKDVPAGKPDSGEGWRLAVKRGQNGRDLRAAGDK